MAKISPISDITILKKTSPNHMWAQNFGEGEWGGEGAARGVGHLNENCETLKCFCRPASGFEYQVVEQTLGFMSLVSKGALWDPGTISTSQRKKPNPHYF